MADANGFLKITQRKTPGYRPIELRIRDYKDVSNPVNQNTACDQASRCMNCGVPYCHFSCPLGNIIPEFNDALYKKDFNKAINIIYKTNNFPEFTGALCPAPCESGCVLGINQPAVTIKQSEKFISDIILSRGLFPRPPKKENGLKVAVIGSGPSGLAASQMLRRRGYSVTVFEKDNKPGGLLRYGIPDFKFEKSILDMRLKQLEGEGIIFKVNSLIKEDKFKKIKNSFDAVILATGAQEPRDMNLKGRSLNGIYFAMDYLTASNKAVQSSNIPSINAKGKTVAVIGGGDTASDCIGTAIRQGARHIINFTIGKEPPNTRSPKEPWPIFASVYSVSSSHAEMYQQGGIRQFLTSAIEFISQKDLGISGDANQLAAIKVAKTKYMPDGSRVPDLTKTSLIKCDMAFIAMGFTGVDKNAPLDYIDSSRIKTDNSYCAGDNVFASGDCRRGASLIVWAIAEGRSLAANVDKYLTGSTDIFEVVHPSSHALKL